jgi:hypothetical protein
MGDFVYFAYGSNMLTARLRERCPSARPLGLAAAPGYGVAFNKQGMDGSGKATLAMLEHDPQKWVPVLRQRSCLNKELEPHSDSIGMEKALAPVRQKRRETAAGLADAPSPTRFTAPSMQAGQDGGAGARGVLFRIDLGERAALDRAEGNYRREDAFAVHCPQGGTPITACTYIAEPHACRDGLAPFDWYVALMRAGAIEHGQDADYIAWLSAIETRIDLDLRRAARMAALAKRHI